MITEPTSLYKNTPEMRTPFLSPIAVYCMHYNAKDTSLIMYTSAPHRGGPLRMYYFFTLLSLHCRQQLQEDINLQNMDLLTSYFEKYEKLTSTTPCKLALSTLCIVTEMSC